MYNNRVPREGGGLGTGTGGEGDSSGLMPNYPAVIRAISW
jgi:hypothetical protein